ncbi:MAG: redoxin domain-containing protein [Deltaproteobacteria bacterium]
MKNSVREKTLKMGDKAPDFIGKTYQGETLTLQAFRGKLVWLIFYRYPQCPLCNLHLKALARRMDKYHSQELEVVAVFESGPERFAGNTISHPGIRMLSDPNKELYRLFETDVSLKAVFRPSVVGTFFKAILSGNSQGPIDGELGQVPASFLIAEDGIIEKIYYGKTIADHIPFSEVESFIQNRLQGTWRSQAKF